MNSPENDLVPIEETCGCEVGCFTKTKKRVPLHFLQCFATPPIALTILCISAFLQGFIVNGLVNASITTLETRFQISSAEAGLIASCYDIASCLFLILVTYVGGRGHKPLWLGWGVVILGLGAVVFSIPRFVARLYEVPNDQFLCSRDDVTQNETLCTDSGLRNNRFAFYAGQLMAGAGAAPLYTLGVTYLDENVEQVKSSLYHGIFYSLSIVGPGIGFLLAGYFLTIFTTLDPNPGILESDPRFVGAWWIPFLAFGIITFLFGFVLLFFPRQLPGTEEVRKNRQKEIFEDKLACGLKNDEDFGKKFKDFPKCLLILLRNLPFVFISLAGAVDGLIATGISTFGPKVIESLFKLNPSQSALAIGAIAIVAGAGGQFLGGLMVFKTKLSVRGILKFCVSCEAITVFCSLIFLLSCPDVLFAGSNVAYSGANLTAGDVFSTCNRDCGCQLNNFDPVCGTDGITYYSSCFAGCSDMINSTVANCSCIPISNNMNISSVSKGPCTSEPCGHGGVITYLVFTFINILIIFGVAIPALQATIRIVLFTQRSFSVGVQWLILRLFGSIPGPLLFGFVLDKACVIYSNSCEEQGSCSVYSNSEIAKNLSIVILTLKSIGVLLYIAAYLSYKCPNGASPSDSNNACNGDTNRKGSELQLTENAVVNQTHENLTFDENSLN